MLYNFALFIVKRCRNFSQRSESSYCRSMAQEMKNIPSWGTTCFMFRYYDPEDDKYKLIGGRDSLTCNIHGWPINNDSEKSTMLRKYAMVLRSGCRDYSNIAVNFLTETLKANDDLFVNLYEYVPEAKSKLQEVLHEYQSPGGHPFMCYEPPADDLVERLHDTLHAMKIPHNIIGVTCSLACWKGKTPHIYRISSENEPTESVTVEAIGIGAAYVLPILTRNLEKNQYVLTRRGAIDLAKAALTHSVRSISGCGGFTYVCSSDEPCIWNQVVNRRPFVFMMSDYPPSHELFKVLRDEEKRSQRSGKRL